MTEKETWTIEIISGVEGSCLALNDTRIAGPKPWGGGKVIYSFKVPVDTFIKEAKKRLEHDG